MFSKIVCALLLIGSTAPAQSAQLASSTQSPEVNPLQRVISVELADVPLSKALQEISSRGGFTLAFSETRLPNTTVRYSAQKVQAGTALFHVLKGTGLEVKSSSQGRLVVVPVSQKKNIGQGIITGKVMDGKTGKTISGVNVSVDGDSRGVVTGDDGSYRLTGIPVGNHTVTVRLVGYAKQTKTVAVGENATVAADFKLEPSANVLDQVVVTGTVIASELRSVPNAITVITAKQIEERGITRIDQLFRGEVPGLFSQNLGSANPLDTVIMFSRGASKFEKAGQAFATNSIKTYVDGVELVNPAYLSQIDPRSIERIEVLTGPQASTIYGSNAINGVMQVFTKRGIGSRPQLTAALFSGWVQNNFSSSLTPQHDYSSQLTNAEGRWSYNIGASWIYMGPWTPSKQSQGVSGFGGGRFQVQSLNLDMSFRRAQSKAQRRGVDEQSWVDRAATGEYDVGGLAYGRSVPPSTSGLDGRTVGASLSYSPTSWMSHELVLGSDESTLESAYVTPSYRTVVDTLLIYRQERNVRSSQRYAATVRFPIVSSSLLTLSFGSDHWRTRSISMGSLGSTTLSGALLTPDIVRNKPSKNTGAFVQGQIGLKEVLFLTYGIRGEWNPTFGNDARILPGRYGFALTHEVGEVSFKLRGSYGRSIRTPLPTQKLGRTSSAIFRRFYGEFPYATLPNPELGPEFQQGGEGGLEVYFSNRGSLVVTRYNQTIDGLIETVIVDSLISLTPNPLVCSSGVPNQDGYCYFRLQQNFNVGNIRNQGWELQGSINAGPLTTRGTYSWTKSRVIGITQSFRNQFPTSFLRGAMFSYLPEHTWSVNMAYSRGGTQMMLNINGVGQMYKLFDDVSDAIRLPRLVENKPRFSESFNYRSVSDGYTVSDLITSHRLSSKIEGVLHISNLSNFYRSDQNTGQATVGRQTRLGLRLKY